MATGKGEKGKRKKMNWAGIPAKDRARVRSLHQSYNKTPQEVYDFLLKRDAEKAAEQEREHSKEESRVALIRDGTLHTRILKLERTLIDLDGLSELLQARLLDGTDGASMTGIDMARGLLKKALTQTGGLLHPLTSEEKAVAHG